MQVFDKPGKQTKLDFLPQTVGGGILFIKITKGH